jgi:hypothetical protein
MPPPKQAQSLLSIPTREVFMFKLFGLLTLAVAFSGCVAAPPYGYSEPVYGPGYYAPGPSIGVGIGGGSFGSGVGVGVGVGF